MSIFSRSSLTSAMRSSDSPSSFWMARSCSRRKYSFWVLPRVFWTWLWMEAPSWCSSISPVRISHSRSSLALGPSASRSAWRSASLKCRLKARR
ncbi:hypothetical protein D3C87_1929160 [compost metagenome]